MISILDVAAPEPPFAPDPAPDDTGPVVDLFPDPTETFFVIL